MLIALQLVVHYGHFIDLISVDDLVVLGISVVEPRVALPYDTFSFASQEQDIEGLRFVVVEKLGLRE